MKDNDAGSLIRLPTSGGALSGLGESFSPDLHTGTANFSIPLTIPAGRNGFKPQLALSYSTGRGQGPFGLGWTLSIPGVSRKTSKGVPRYQDGDPLSTQADVFLLSGADDLVPIDAPRPGESIYRPRIEGLFARISRRRDVARGADYWEVCTPDGLTSYYGTNPTDAPVYPDTWSALVGDPAITAKPDPPDKIFSWALTLTLDAFGNRIEYLYERDQGVPRIKQIRYVDHGDRDEPRFLVAVEFEYDLRPDPFSDCRAGFEVRETQRCRSIRWSTHADAARPGKEYRFRYREDPATRLSLLEAVESFGFDADGTRIGSLPPLELSYTRFEPHRPDRRSLRPVQGSQLPAASLAHPTLALADLHGQGLPDLLEVGESVRYWQNLGGGNFAAPRPMLDAPAGLSLADPRVRLLDADGDGRMDLMVRRESLAGYFPLRFGARLDRSSFRRWSTAPSIDFDDPELRLMDLTGDGVTDALRTGTRLEAYFSDPEKGWYETRSLARAPAATFPDVTFSDERVLTGDMNGDGLADIVLVRDGMVCYWPSCGYGEFGARVLMRNAPRLPRDYQPGRLLLGDVNGDGLADLIYVDHHRIQLWINQSGNGWSAPIAIEGTPGVQQAEAIRLVDLLGSGIPGILWTSDRIDIGRPHYFFLDLTGGAKPYLLNGMRNNLGAETSVEYRSSTEYYLADRRAGVIPWQTNLPFPVQTVANVVVTDSLTASRLVTRYTYHHGYWDGREREFRGFGRVEQFDAETFTQIETRDSSGMHSPPLWTKHWFHQGAADEDTTGAGFEGEYWSGDPSQLDQGGLTTRLCAELEVQLSMETRQLSSAERARQRRDALRALRGSLLRTEIYALDGDERQTRPYTVTESSFGFRQEAGPTPDHARRGVFFRYPYAQRTTQWERGNDPLNQFVYFQRYDHFGHCVMQTQVACPRGWRSLEQRPDAAYLATRTRTAYATAAAGDAYIHDRVARIDKFEIEQSTGKRLLEIVELDDDDLALQRIGQTLKFYDGPAFIGLPLGSCGRYGAMCRSDQLVLTPEILTRAYAAASPAYLETGSWTWPATYPSAFRAAVAPVAGYRRHAGDEPGIAAGLFAIEQQLEYDFQRTGNVEGRGLVLRRRDPLGRETQLEYQFDLLPTAVTDAAGLVTRAEYDLRFLSPRTVVDPNGNRRDCELDSTGLLRAAWLRGKTSVEGDLVQPSLQLSYDFFAFMQRGEPISVGSVRSVHHDTASGLTSEQGAERIESREYSDGFGRMLQTRARSEDLRFGDERFGGDVLPIEQADPGSAAPIGHRITGDLPNVIVTGWQRYDNKGRVVEKHEPFFSEGWQFARDVGRGRSIRMFYDPRGQLIRTLQPDGSEERVIYGVPSDLDTPTDPSTITTTPWAAYSYDANDNAGRTHTGSAESYRLHWNTPSSIQIDALGRSVCAVTRTRGPAPEGGALPAVEEHRTRSTYDVAGNLLTLNDALDRHAYRYVYDLAQRPLRAESIDAGTHTLVYDAIGAEIERRDDKGAWILRTYDILQRPDRVWARDHAGQPLTLRETTHYGDGGRSDQPEADREAARAVNSLGKPVRQRDEAGELRFGAYDFKGNLLTKSRRVIADEPLVACLDRSGGAARSFSVDWDAPPPLTAAYETSLVYDALDRVVAVVCPEDAGSTRPAPSRRVLRPRYDRASRLTQISVDDEIYVERVAYDASGQRTLIAYGNGILTRHAYDAQTMRLTRTRSERFSVATAGTYTPTGGVLQDSAYRYDLSGNIVMISERVAGCGVRDGLQGADALDRTFEYDPLYRLTRATGRESLGIANPRPWQDLARNGYDSAKHATADQDNAPQLTREYWETYAYDPVGNLLALSHSGNWTRRFGMGGFTPGQWMEKLSMQRTGGSPEWGNLGNRSTHFTTDDNPIPTHIHDGSGNLIRELSNRHFAWDHANRMIAFADRASETSAASVEATYLYDARGQRVKKLVRRQTGELEATVYIDGLFEHERWTTPGKPSGENSTLHVLDNQSRIATLRVGDARPGDGAPAISVRYVFSDHLSSSSIVIGGSDAQANTFVSREEYYPYGETSFGSFGRKRYRFAGRERDDASGLHYFGARYFSSASVRWSSVDPISRPGSSYQYCSDSPISRSDYDGKQDARANLVRDFQEATLHELARSETQTVNERALNSRGKIFTGTPNEVEFTGRLLAHTHPNDGPQSFRLPSLGREGSDMAYFMSRRATEKVIEENVIFWRNGVTYFRNDGRLPYITVMEYRGGAPQFYLVNGSTHSGFELESISAQQLAARLAAAHEASRAVTVEMPAVVSNSKLNTLGKAGSMLAGAGLFVVLSGVVQSPHTYAYDTEQAELDYMLGARSEPPHLRDQRLKLEAEIAASAAERAHALRYSLEAAGGHSGSDR